MKPPTDPAKPDPAAVPEKYEFKAPENYTIDAKLIDEVTPIFKELGLTNDQAQKLFDIQVARELANAKAPADAYAATRAEWQTAVKTDPEISRAGLDAVKADIGRALNTLPPDLATDFRKAMDVTGAGDHPAFVKAMWKFSQAISEGKHVAGAAPSPAGQRSPSGRPPSTASALYPNLK